MFGLVGFEALFYGLLGALLKVATRSRWWPRAGRGLLDRRRVHLRAVPVQRLRLDASRFRDGRLAAGLGAAAGRRRRPQLRHGPGRPGHRAGWPSHPVRGTAAHRRRRRSPGSSPSPAQGRWCRPASRWARSTPATCRAVRPGGGVYGLGEAAHDHPQPRRRDLPPRRAGRRRRGGRSPTSSSCRRTPPTWTRTRTPPPASWSRSAVQRIGVPALVGVILAGPGVGRAPDRVAVVGPGGRRGLPLHQARHRAVRRVGAAALPAAADHPRTAVRGGAVRSRHQPRARCP